MVGPIVVMCVISCIGLLIAGIVIYDKGVEAGSKRQLAKVGKGILTKALTLKLPREDFRSVDFGYSVPSTTATIELRRADRITIEIHEHSTSEVGIGALIDGKVQ